MLMYNKKMLNYPLIIHFILNTNNHLKAEIKIGWKRDSRYGDHHKIKEEVRNILKSMGYNTEILEVTST